MKRLLLLSATISIMFLQNSAKAQSAEEKAWMEYMTPGAIHQMIAKSDGEWSFDMSMWMAPNTAPTSSTGTTVNKMVLGGRYQESVHKGTLMGMPFEGHSLLAYDNAKKIFQNTWVDNMGTGIMKMEGTWDDATKSITLTGTTVDPSTGKDMNVREVFKMVDDDHQTMEMYMNHNGQEFKTMEIKYTRKK